MNQYSTDCIASWLRPFAVVTFHGSFGCTSKKTRLALISKNFVGSGNQQCIVLVDCFLNFLVR